VYTQSAMERYASVSKTDINLFAGNQWSVGTLRRQTQLDPEAIGRMVPCDELITSKVAITVAPFILGDRRYYQGQCALKDAQKVIGAITVSLSQEIEKQGIKKMLTAVLMISGIVVGVAFALTLAFSRKAIQAIHNIVSVIGSASSGDLRQTAAVMTHDEVGMLAVKLNQMITQLRTIRRRRMN